LKLSNLILLLPTFFFQLSLFLLILLKGKRDRSSQSFVAFTLFFAFWTLSYIILDLIPLDSDISVWFRLVYVGPIFIPLLLYFSRSFLSDVDHGWFWYVLAPCLLLLLIPTSFYMSSAIKTSDGVIEVERNFGTILFAFYFVGNVLVSLYVLANKYLKLKGLDKKRVLFILIGMGLTCLFGISLNLVLPLIGFEKYLSIGPTSAVFFLGMTTLSMMKYSFLDMQVAVTKIIASIATILLIIGSLLFVYIITGQNSVSLFICLALSVFWTFYGLNIRRMIQTPLEDKWLKGSYNFNELMNSIVLGLMEAVNREDVFDVVSTILKRELQIKEIFNFIAKQDQHSGEIVYYQLESKAVVATNIDQLRALIGDDILDNLSVLNDKLPSYIVSAGVILIPIKINDRLEGFIVFGEKLSEDVYTPDEYQLFSTLSHQMGMAIHRIEPYEKSLRKLYDTERQLARSEKIASLAHTIQEYNHEIKTPLSVIKYWVKQMSKGTLSMDEIKSKSALLAGRIDRIDDIVETTLRISRPNNKKSQDSIYINKLLKEVVEDLPPNSNTIKWNLTDVPMFIGSQEDLGMAFNNIIVNAYEAMFENTGHLTISSYVINEDSERYLCCEFEDEGCGIDKENLEQIFEPFYSTKVTEGRGLGLSLTFRIIREHLGHIDVQSVLGVGSKFRLKFKLLI
jgi:signal transduction histidine kinase